jgi:hypothetical protein
MDGFVTIISDGIPISLLNICIDIFLKKEFS